MDDYGDNFPEFNQKDFKISNDKFKKHKPIGDIEAKEFKEQWKEVMFFGDIEKELSQK